jgi:hypothetical protein
MTITPAMIMENVFNVAYLLTVWILVIVMGTRIKKAGVKAMAARFFLAFALLAAGDTFHVGFRVLTALLAPGTAMLTVGGVPSAMIGLGMLATAYTMTAFYMVLADALRLRLGEKYDAGFIAVQALLFTRLIIMALPGNAWESSVPPYAMGLLRNLPLSIAGVILAIRCIMAAKGANGKTWSGIGWSMVASYAFYIPVILFAAAIPAIGLLMIPKTIAYVVMGVMAYKGFWRE